MRHVRDILVVPALVLGVSGCGGGGSAGNGSTAAGGTGGGGNGEFPVLTGDSAAQVPVPAGSQEIIGSHAISLFSVRNIQLQKTNGAQRNSDGRVVLADGTSTFTGNGGYSANGSQSGTSGELTLLATNNTYQSAVMYKGGIADPANVNFYGIMQGVYGIAAQPGSITTSGTALYTGDARGSFQGTERIQLNSGRSQVSVDFGAGMADVTLDQFNTTAVNFDTISMSGMSINGNRFDGGTFTTLNNGSVVNNLGGDAQATATGAFFGTVDAAGVPPEVGGQIYARGDTGALIGTFLAK